MVLCSNNHEGLVVLVTASHYIDFFWCVPFGHDTFKFQSVDHDRGCGDCYVIGIVHENGGSPTAKENTLGLSDRRFGKPEQLDWVTAMTEINRKDETYVHYGNESTLVWVYGVLCLIVRIGKAGERLAYPTVAALNKARSLRAVSPESLLEWDGDWGEDENEDDDDEGASDILYY